MTEYQIQKLVNERFRELKHSAKAKLKEKSEAHMARAVQIQGELATLGIELQDSVAGTTWRRLNL
jgi:cysteinyl-tRNA synthetase